jgi:flagellar basal-body rod modification protein FlgD
MNSTLKSIADKLTGTSANDALAYVGKTVLTQGDTAFGRTTGGIAGAVDVDSAASDLKVTIQDQSGNVLKTLDLGAQTKGTVNFDWDGKTEAGADAGAGPFKVVSTANANGATVATHTLVWAPVTSVSMPSSGSPVLNVAGIGNVDLSAVRQIG